MTTNSLQIYSVGGAVRDKLLGLPVQDHDWVVIGSTPEEMLKRGFRPVGKDFPVFLHPHTHEEYALARTERKLAPGYKGFVVHAAPEITLAQDLQRRDFTINALALSGKGELIDPYGGEADLRAGILRHVSTAFCEDPLRILRAARFVARFGFSIAPETLELMRIMVANGEVDALIAERVWQEIARGLMEKNPSRFFTTLRECGALFKILPELDTLFGVPQPPHYHPEIDCGIHSLLVLDAAAKQDYPLQVRFAALTHDLGKGNTPKDSLPHHHGHEERGAELLKILCQRLRVPAECRDLGLLVARYHSTVHRAKELRSATIVKLFQDCDAWRRPARFEQLLQTCASDARGRSGHAEDSYPQAAFLLRALSATQMLNAGQIAQQCEHKSQIPEQLKLARIRVISQLTITGVN